MMKLTCLPNCTHFHLLPLPKRPAFFSLTFFLWLFLYFSLLVMFGRMIYLSLIEWMSLSSLDMSWKFRNECKIFLNFYRLKLGNSNKREDSVNRKSKNPLIFPFNGLWENWVLLTTLSLSQIHQPSRVIHFLIRIIHLFINEWYQSRPISSRRKGQHM